MKKQFTIPHVFLADVVSPNDVGTGSLPGGWGQSFKPVPMSFAEWAQSRWVADYDENPGVDFQDYAKWWAQASLGETAWAQFNPGASLEEDR